MEERLSIAKTAYSGLIKFKADTNTSKQMTWIARVEKRFTKN
jgi:hypothetical protein